MHVPEGGFLDGLGVVEQTEDMHYDGQLIPFHRVLLYLLGDDIIIFGLAIPMVFVDLALDQILGEVLGQVGQYLQSLVRVHIGHLLHLLVLEVRGPQADLNQPMQYLWVCYQPIQLIYVFTSM